MPSNRLLRRMDRERQIKRGAMVGGAVVIDNEKLLRGLTLHRAGDVDGAAQIYHELEQDHSPHWHARYLAAMICNHKCLHAEAIDLLRGVVEAMPQWEEALYNLGVCLQESGDPNEAAMWYKRAIAVAPDFSSAWLNLGNARLAQGNVAAAVEHWEAAIALRPKNPEARYNLSHGLLLLGRWKEGWAYYESRWQTPGFQATNGLRGSHGHMWDGTPLEGRRLLVFAEQGLGDTLMCLRYGPQLRALGARLVWRVQASLVPLVRAMMPAGEQVISDTDTALGAHDYIVPLMSLPHALHTTPDTVPLGEGYIPQLFGERRKRGNKRVGLLWAGSPQHKNDLNRSIGLAKLAPLFSVDGVTWISLQVGPRAKDVEQVEGVPNTMMPPAVHNFLDTARLVTTLDLVIAVDSGVAHLSGAMGIPTWLLIPAVPDMRWPLTGERTPWYDSMRIFRQPIAGDWETVVMQVKEELEKWIASPSL